jgi:catechol 2,3-dioxygenase-like lactoylglutathione lyase family enzyme
MPEIPMISQPAKSCMTGLLALTLGLGGHSHTFRKGSPPAEADPPVLLNTCLVTNDVARLTEFYERVLQIPPKKIASEYVEFPTRVGVLAIFSANAQEKYIPHSAEPGNNRSAILEFRVLDADMEYKRLQTIVTAWVKPSTTQPWGTRSIYFRDPDGNLVDFFTPPRTAP